MENEIFSVTLTMSSAGEILDVSVQSDMIVGDGDDKLDLPPDDFILLTTEKITGPTSAAETDANLLELPAAPRAIVAQRSPPCPAGQVRCYRKLAGGLNLAFCKKPPCP